MNAKNDLTGKKFGKLTVLERSQKKSKSGHALWNCRCDCGNEVTVLSHHLKNGTVSCGCVRKGVNSIDITGQRFGRLTAVRKTDEHLGNSIIWECQCDCGNVCKVASVNLRNGNTKSCGCIASEVHKKSFKTAKSKRNEYYVDGTDVISLSQGIRSNNSSGHIGVSLESGRWRAYIGFKGKVYKLGRYDDIADAIAARKYAEKQLHRNFLDWYQSEYPERWKKLIKNHETTSQ